MKNITKIFSFLLLLVFCISFIACGEEEDKGDNGIRRPWQGEGGKIS